MFPGHYDFSHFVKAHALEGVSVSPEGNWDDVKTFHPMDENHGTAVAGVIIGRNNGVFSDPRFLSVRFVRTAYQANMTQSADAISKCIFADGSGPDVITASYSAQMTDPVETGNPERGAINALYAKSGAFFFGSAGNAHVDEQETDPYRSPCALPGMDAVFCVAAVDRHFTMLEQSQRHDRVSIAAPGVNILTQSIEGISAYVKEDGTSFSTPMVAGAVALLRSYTNPSVTTRQIYAAILQTATRNRYPNAEVDCWRGCGNPICDVKDVGAGVLNIDRAYSLLIGEHQPACSNEA
jgi:subtilisin family serine protease